LLIENTFSPLRKFLSRGILIINIMKFRGWLLDVDYEVVNNRPLIRMWCVDDTGRSAVIFDDSFEPYFYVVPYGDVPVSQLQNMSEEVGGELIRPVKIDVVDRRNFGVPIKCYRIFTQLPRDVPYLRELALKFGDVREADILFGVRYIIDKRLIPMGGIEAEGEPVPVDYAGSGLLCRSPKAFARQDEPPLKIMAFDCEMWNPHGMPDPKDDPIIIIPLRPGTRRKFSRPPARTIKTSSKNLSSMSKITTRTSSSAITRTASTGRTSRNGRKAQDQAQRVPRWLFAHVRAGRPAKKDQAHRAP